MTYYLLLIQAAEDESPLVRLIKWMLDLLMALAGIDF